VKTEGDAFIVSFQSVTAALLWCFVVQTELLTADWPLEILESEEGREVIDQHGCTVARGLSVRMGIHCGKPVCALDPLTSRMDYFGTMVNRTARISAMAQGGQIMVSSDVVNEINTQLDETSVDPASSGKEALTNIETLKKMEVVIHKFGERSLKGLEVPEVLSLVFPRDLVGRLELRIAPPPAAGSRVQFNVEQLKQLALLTIRLESLTSSRVFRNASERPAQEMTEHGINPVAGDTSVILWADPDILLPNIKRDPSDQDLLLLLDSLSVRIENALSTLHLKHLGGFTSVLGALENATLVDQNMVLQALRMFQGITTTPST